MSDVATPTATKSCGGGSESHFNYCLFAKGVVAIPALTAVAFIPTLVFETPIFQGIGAVVAVAATIYAAIWIDRLPSLKKKIQLLPQQQKQ